MLFDERKKIARQRSGFCSTCAISKYSKRPINRGVGGGEEVHL